MASNQPTQKQKSTHSPQPAPVTIWGVIKGTITGGDAVPITRARVQVTFGTATPIKVETDKDGKYTLTCVCALPTRCVVEAESFAIPAEKIFVIDSNEIQVDLEIKLGLGIGMEVIGDGATIKGGVKEGVWVKLTREGLDAADKSMVLTHVWRPSGGNIVETKELRDSKTVTWDTTGLAGKAEIDLTVSDPSGTSIRIADTLYVARVPTTHVAPLALRRAAAPETRDIALWAVIRKSAEALSFGAGYNRFMNWVLCGDGPGDGPAWEKFEALQQKRFLPYTDTDAYRLLKAATEAFVMIHCAVKLDPWDFDTTDVEYLEQRLDTSLPQDILDRLWDAYLCKVNGSKDLTLPYLALLKKKLPDWELADVAPGLDPDADLPKCSARILSRKFADPCLLELIWSYWMEEGMLVQTMNAIGRRFQNVRGPGISEPLVNLEIDPLRPLNNLLWGYIQDEQHRLTVVRRAYEYNHQYGLTLYGKAIPQLRPADSRSKFLEAFHNLLYLCTVFYKQADDTTVVPDGFPILNALREVHLLLSEGAHNQFGDLTSTARIEMLMQQWLLARPEFREFLPTRIMVAYPEPWMDRVDAMAKLQSWADISILHFYHLAVFGEQILLGIRYGAWSDINDPVQAGNWARFWRPHIQGYSHAYRAVTGVDLTAETTTNQMLALRSAQPSALLLRRLQRGDALPALPTQATRPAAHRGFRERREDRKR